MNNLITEHINDGFLKPGSNIGNFIFISFGMGLDVTADGSFDTAEAEVVLFFV